MKKLSVITCFTCFSMVFGACSNHEAHKGDKDTVSNRFGSANDTGGSAKSTIDTSKITSGDNSASGGVKALADTTKQKDIPKK